MNSTCSIGKKKTPILLWALESFKEKSTRDTLQINIYSFEVSHYFGNLRGRAMLDNLFAFFKDFIRDLTLESGPWTDAKTKNDLQSIKAKLHDISHVGGPSSVLCSIFIYAKAMK